MTDLFSYAPARTTDPPTSHEAAASVNTTHDQAIIIEALTRHGPMTMHNVAKLLNRDVTCISSRFSELRDAGQITVAGKELGERGRNRILWSVV